MGDMLAGRVAVVTGAGRGIGRGVALALAAARRAGRRQRLRRRASTGARRRAARATTSSRRSRRRAARPSRTPTRSPSGTAPSASSAPRSSASAASTSLVTCAGILRDRMIFNMSEEEWDAVVAVHLKGTFNCIRHACARMREQRYGRIVTFTSGAGLFGNPGQANYGAAKAAIGGLTKVVARDLGKYGITVNAISPVAGTRMTLTDEVLQGARDPQAAGHPARGPRRRRHREPRPRRRRADGRLPRERARGERERAVLPLLRQVDRARLAAAAGADDLQVRGRLDARRARPPRADDASLDGLVNPAPPKEA